MEEIYNIPVTIEFIDKTKATISYTIGNNQLSKDFLLSDTLITEHAKFKVIIEEYKKLDAQKQESNNQFFFTIYDPGSIVPRYLSQLEINILNEKARTIQITTKDNNAKKASDIANAIGSEFLIFDKEKKGESADNVIIFIDNQLGMVYDRLYETENDFMFLQDTF